MRSPIAWTISLALLVVGLALWGISQPLTRGARPSRLPAPTAIAGSFFGMTVHQYQTTTPWPSIPFSSLRTWDTRVTWPDINPAPDTYEWSGVDELINLATSHHVDVLFTLGRTPRWASASPDTPTPYGPGQCAPPAKMEYWDKFLQAIVSHVGGKIRFWETWNEPQSPDSEVYCGSIPTMVDLQRRTYEIIKTADPNALILTPSPVGGYGPSWMSRFLAAGGGNYADIMAFHGYLAPGASAESIISTITKFKAIFSGNGQKEKPVWDTEAGWGKDAGLPDPTQQAAFLAKFFILHWSAGIDRFYWYAYDNDVWGTLWEPGKGLNKAGLAYSEVHKWLLGAIMTTPCALKDAVWTCSLDRPNGYRAIVLWTSSDVPAPKRPTSILVSRDFRQTRDLEGHLQQVAGASVSISEAPILVETASAF